MHRPSDHTEPASASSPSVKAMAEVLLSTELLEALPDAVVAVDRDGTIVQANSQAQELFGYESDELIGQKVEMLVPEAYRRQHHQHRENFSQTPKTRRMGAELELYGRRRNGSEFPVEISLSPVSTERGTLVLSAIRDISDRKRIAEELRRANEELHRRTIEQLGEYRSRLASIIDSSEDAILSKDLNGIITSWNKGAERIYGYAPEEVVGKHISLLTPGDRPDEISEILQKIARGESTEHYESVRVTKDKRHLSVSISVSPLRNEAGEIVGASAIARDITTQKRTEGQLRQSQKMEAIGRLAGGVAHDFNNILGIINACSEFLRDRIDPASEPSVYVENIKKAIERGRSLTKQMMAFSRTSAVQPCILDLNERLREISKLLRPLLGDDIEILIVPRSATAVVEMDPGQLDQIVVNLAVNARDAMPRGGKFILETGAVDFDDRFATLQSAAAGGSGLHAFTTGDTGDHRVKPESGSVAKTLTDSTGVGREGRDSSGEICAAGGERYRQWHGRGDGVAYLRAFLYHQRGGQRNWSGPGHGVWDRQAERRTYPGLQRAGPGNDVQNLSAERGAQDRARIQAGGGDGASETKGGDDPAGRGRRNHARPDSKAP